MRRLSYLQQIPQTWAKKKISGNKALADLVATHSPSTGANYYDYWLLYSLIRKNKLREVLELGPGITTLVIAQALYENGVGRVTAMEDIEKYRDALLEVIPAHLKPFIDLNLSPSREAHWGPFRGRAYGAIPQRNYELIWVDGPNYDRETEFDVDILELVSKSDKPITAYVDGRIPSCFIYKLIFGRKFKYDNIRRLGILVASKHDMRSQRKVSSAIQFRGTIFGLLRI